MRVLVSMAFCFGGGYLLRLSSVDVDLFLLGGINATAIGFAVATSGVRLGH